MRNSSGSGTAIVIMAVVLLGLGACAKHEEAPPIAALPPPPPPPAPPPPPPSPDDLLQAALANIGAKPTDGGWTVTLSTAKYKAGKVSFAPGDAATVGKVTELLKANLQLRVLIEDYGDVGRSKAHAKELSQMHANAVLRDLTSSGVDAGKVQAQGKIGGRKDLGVEIIFSNAAGEFRPAPVENS